MPGIENAFDILIVHGTEGRPDGNWFPWLRDALRKDGHRVAVPAFPTPEGQSFDSWLAVANQALADFDPARTILIGHSTGAIFTLRLAELAQQPNRAMFPVCPFMSDLGLPDYDPLNATFVHYAFDWPRIRRNAATIACFAGDNDPSVALGEARAVAEAAGASLTVIAGGGHLNAEAGYLKFPQLLDAVQRVVRS